MSKKLSIEELEQRAAAAEKRAKELRAKAKEQTEMERMKVNKDVLKAVEEWWKTFPPEKQMAWDQVPEYFRNWAAKNREKYGA